MWQNSKGFFRNMIIYFIPFIFMALVAVFFLHHSFIMLQKQNMSIMKAQLQNVLEQKMMQIRLLPYRKWYHISHG